MDELDTLNSLLDALQARLPRLIAEHPLDSDFWVAFAREAEAIEDQSDEHTCEHVMQRISAMLAEHGRYLASVEIE